MFMREWIRDVRVGLVQLGISPLDILKMQVCEVIDCIKALDKKQEWEAYLAFVMANGSKLRKPIKLKDIYTPKFKKTKTTSKEEYERIKAKWQMSKRQV